MVSEMLELCEERGILTSYDGIELVGLGETVVKDAKTPFPTIFVVVDGHPKYFLAKDRRGAGVVFNWGGPVGAKAITHGASGVIFKGFKLDRGKRTPEEFAKKFNAAVAWYREKYEERYGPLPPPTDGDAAGCGCGAGCASPCLLESDESDEDGGGKRPKTSGGFALVPLVPMDAMKRE